MKRNSRARDRRRAAAARNREYNKSRLHPQGEIPGRWTKSQTHRKERRTQEDPLVELEEIEMEREMERQERMWEAWENCTCRVCDY